MEIAVSAIILLVVNILYSEGQGDTSISSYLATSEGKSQIGSSLEELHAPDCTMCALYCIRRRPPCSGVNYDVAKHKCFLMEDGGSRDLEEAPGFVFIGMVSIPFHGEVYHGELAQMFFYRLRRLGCKIQARAVVCPCCLKVHFFWRIFLSARFIRGSHGNQ